MSKDIKITIFTPQDLNHSSFMQTAFFELAHKGEVNCEVKIDLNLKKGRLLVNDQDDLIESDHQQAKTSYYLYENYTTKKRVYFAADLYDVPNHFSSYALENCQIVFKRNFMSKYVNRLPFKDKIVPIGLTFGCQSQVRKSWLILVTSYIIMICKTELKFDRKIFKRISRIRKRINSHLKYVTKGREIDKFREYKTSTKNQVFYQVRCFPNESVDFVKEINEERAFLIRKLKDNLGEKYLGGLVPDEIAKNKFPNELTALSTDPNDYLNFIKESCICIYTKGLQNSPARKLPEYLSQGKCIVAERFDTELPYDLKNGVHIFYYDDIDECIEICKKLLKNRNLVEQVSKNAREFYENFLDPVTVGRQIIKKLDNNA